MSLCRFQNKSASHPCAGLSLLSPLSPLAQSAQPVCLFLVLQSLLRLPPSLVPPTGGATCQLLPQPPAWRASKSNLPKVAAPHLRSSLPSSRVKLRRHDHHRLLNFSFFPNSTKSIPIYINTRGFRFFFSFLFSFFSPAVFFSFFRSLFFYFFSRSFFFSSTAMSIGLHAPSFVKIDSPLLPYYSLYNFSNQFSPYFFLSILL